MLKYAQMQQRAATLFEQNYYNEMFCSYYEEDELLDFMQQHDKVLHNYVSKLKADTYTHFVNVLFAVLRYNERCAIVTSQAGLSPETEGRRGLPPGGGPPQKVAPSVPGSRQRPCEPC